MDYGTLVSIYRDLNRTAPNRRDEHNKIGVKYFCFILDEFGARTITFDSCSIVGTYTIATKRHYITQCQFAFALCLSVCMRSSTCVCLYVVSTC